MIRALTPGQEVALTEKLAELEHEQWRKWSNELAKEIAEYLNWLPEDMRIELSARLTRWNSLWVPYDELTEKAKEQDRVWARKVLQVFKELNMGVLLK